VEGGGFGMFATLDHGAYRGVDVVIDAPDRSESHDHTDEGVDRSDCHDQNRRALDRDSNLARDLPEECLNQ